MYRMAECQASVGGNGWNNLEKMVAEGGTVTVRQKVLV